MPEVPRNPLSCTRCKSKKIKCGREEPRCDKCTATKADCAYPTRRQKTHTAKKRADILAQILRRLDAVENKIGLSTRPLPLKDGATAHSIADGSTIGDDDMDEDDDDDEDEGEEGSAMEGNHSEGEKHFGSLYQLMDEAASTTKDVFSNAPQNISPDREQDATALFKASLASIRTFRWKDNSSEKVAIPDYLAHEWIEQCFQFPFYEQIIGSANKNLIMAMPSIMKSPVVHVHYSVVVVYYNVLFCGWRGDERSLLPEWKDFGRKLYRACLKILPAWKNDGLPATMMDCIALGMLTITAIENFDYHLGWDLHLACCDVAREMKLDKMDDPNANIRPSGYVDEAEKNLMRKRFWQLIHMEYFFRLYYDRPPSMTESDFKVNLPSMTTDSDSAHTVDSIYFLVNSRVVFITKEFFDVILKGGPDLKTNVRALTDQIEAAIDEWNLNNLLVEQKHGEAINTKWMYADLLVNAYITIILMERKAFGSKMKTNPPSIRCVRAARKTLETMNVLSKLLSAQSPCFMNFISFYPFVAFFTLYHHILYTLQKRPQVKSPDNITISAMQRDVLESDISLMEDLAILLGNLALSQEEYHLVANAVITLTKASRRLLLVSLPPTPTSTTSAALTPPSHDPHDIRALKRMARKSDNNTSVPTSQPVSVPDDFAFPWSAATDGSVWPQLEAGSQQHGLTTPFMYVESMESDLFGKNWHQAWWDQ